jgi:lipopolysaccharide transport system ATP-binding protein
MPSVLRLCPRVILLDGGHLTADGTGSHVVEEYAGRGGGAAERVWPELAKAPGDDQVRLKSVRLLNEQGEPVPEVEISEPVFVEVEYWNLSEDRDFRPSVNLHFFNAEGVCLFVTWDANNLEWRKRPRGRGTVRTRCRIPGNFFAEGGVFVTANISSIEPLEIHVAVDDVVVMHVLDESGGGGVRGNYVGDWPGALRPMLNWEAELEPAP